MTLLRKTKPICGSRNERNILFNNGLWQWTPPSESKKQSQSNPIPKKTKWQSSKHAWHSTFCKTKPISERLNRRKHSIYKCLRKHAPPGCRENKANQSQFQVPASAPKQRQANGRLRRSFPVSVGEKVDFSDECSILLWKRLGWWAEPFGKVYLEHSRMGSAQANNRRAGYGNRREENSA